MRARCSTNYLKEAEAGQLGEQRELLYGLKLMSSDGCRAKRAVVWAIKWQLSSKYLQYNNAI
ncbi:hypothetical protein Pyn_38793 [Prunus yedoensis var. nudiflora]|uniref:Uncharacterized protein n=1 Tax=Prunus yedoensis var. nudiflora TaxID=2094558 RepID=A0A314Z2P2_PRUYE|nr:hypothetical protein Pyn_38793 [Prunus yedoensis var. nudiflora]